MFYAPEILSYKNKTELALIYCLSTTKTLKGIPKKEVINLNFNRILEEIRNPQIPFALRLYSYLLKGLVKLWVIKVDFYRAEVKRSMQPRRRIKRGTNNPSNINLRMIASDYNDCIENDYTDCIDKDDIDVDSINIDNGISIKRCKRLMVDKNTEIDPNNLYATTIQASFNNNSNDVLGYKLHVPLIDLFNRTTQNSLLHNTIQNVFEMDNVSIEDPRILSNLLSNLSSNLSNSSSQSNSIHLNPNHNNERTPAMWFYNLLVEASKGEIRLEQREPFGEITIQSPNTITVLN